MSSSIHPPSLKPGLVLSPRPPTYFFIQYPPTPPFKMLPIAKIQKLPHPNLGIIHRFPPSPNQPQNFVKHDASDSYAWNRKKRTENRTETMSAVGRKKHCLYSFFRLGFWRTRGYLNGTTVIEKLFLEKEKTLDRRCRLREWPPCCSWFVRM